MTTTKWIAAAGHRTHTRTTCMAKDVASFEQVSYVALTHFGSIL